jgi:hypothetical protein
LKNTYIYVKQKPTIMKKTYLTFLSILLCFYVSAQVPQGINYQAVARNASGAVLANQAIGLRFTIHDVSASGTKVYEETFMGTTTNQFGLFTIVIGTGTQVGSTTFTSVAWGTNAKFLQVEIDPAGGTAYTDMGTTQMVSVPYALYAQSAGTAASTPGTGIYFSATSDTNTVFQTGFSQIPFQTAVVNDGNAYSNTSNAFTAPSAGLYHFDVNLVESGGGGYLFLVINNTVEVASTQAYLANTSLTQPMALSATFKLNANDVVTVIVQSFNANNLITYHGGGNFWDGYKVY